MDTHRRPTREFLPFLSSFHTFYNPQAPCPLVEKRPPRGERVVNFCLLSLPSTFLRALSIIFTAIGLGFMALYSAVTGASVWMMPVSADVSG